ncbi:MAG: hypothetical protein BZY81_00535 [SAR202 cluster bacterium Io17-Chloro-G4]|nr:MAG: hypothetical protein BZY81_00535 [SAR202 cluster bacterium Io17-Chloro-G4]
METLLAFALSVTGISLLVWIWLVLGRGYYWKMDQTLRVQSSPDPPGEDVWPSVKIVVPARNEAETLPTTLPSLLNQDYPGPFTVVLVDDQSTDGTWELAIGLGKEHGDSQRLRVHAGEQLPPGWTGKLWALEQGVRAESGGQSQDRAVDFFLFTDADISHPPESLRSLVSKALLDELDLVSVMAHLHVRIGWDRLLIPAFVYFFAKLYPFRWVNDPDKRTAAAAGGCVLLRSDALFHAGGIEQISGEIIDDCALAVLIKKSPRPGGGRIWLGLAHNIRSLRVNRSVKDIWNMVTRTAYTQLRQSPAMLIATILGMALVYLVPVGGAFGGLAAGIIDQNSALALWLLVAGLCSWMLMAGSYLPTLKRYSLSPILAFALPVTAGLYTLMTIDSARRSWQGRSANWKGRTYSL